MGFSRYTSLRLRRHRIAALYVALRHLNKSYAAIGAIVAIACQILFLAYIPVVQGLAYLGDQYAAATTDVQRTS